MSTRTIRIDYLPDLSLPDYLSRYGAQGEKLARDALQPILGQLCPGSEEGFALTYAIDPVAPKKQERLKIYLTTQNQDDQKSQEPFNGSHALNAFYRWQQAETDEVFRFLEKCNGSIHCLEKIEETYLQGDSFFHVPVPFASPGSAALSKSMLDDLFDGLRFPCILSIFLRPTCLTTDERNSLVYEIQRLERLASGKNPERSDAGTLEELLRGKNTLAERTREFWRIYETEMFRAPVFEFHILVASHDKKEGRMVLQTVGLELLPDGKFEISSFNQNDGKYLCHFDALASQHNIFSYPDIFGLPCFCRHLAACQNEDIKDLKKQFMSAIKRSRFGRLVTWDLAKRMISLPTSTGVYLRTIQIESELPKSKKYDNAACLKIGTKLGRDEAALLPLALLVKHPLLVGASGSGKTVTAMEILTPLYEEFGVTFTIFVPIADPYRMLFRSEGKLGQDIRLYSPGNDGLSPFVANLLEVPEDLPVDTHIANLEVVFAGAFENEGPLRPLLRAALEHCYRNVGLKPSDRGSADASYPTMKDLAFSIQYMMEERGYVGETRENIKAALETRFIPLTSGSVGRVFNCQRSSPSLDELLSYPTIIEMDWLNQSQQSLLTLHQIMRIRRRRDRMGHSEGLKHLIVLEESHALIGMENRTGTNNSQADPRLHAAQYILKCIAEGRDLGMGFMIIDQSPSAIGEEIIRNSGVKIAHCISEARDSEIMSSAMQMSLIETRQLEDLLPGECYLRHENLHRPIKVNTYHRYNKNKRPTEEEIIRLIRDRAWFQEKKDKRFRLRRKQLDAILERLKGLLVEIVRLKSCKGGAEEYRSLQAKCMKAINQGIRKLEDLLGEASLDRAMKDDWKGLDAHYRIRLKSLLETAGDYILKEAHNGKEKQIRMAGNPARKRGKYGRRAQGV